MDAQKTALNNVMLLKPEVFEDHRGEYVELYNEREFAEIGITTKFVQDDISVSSVNVLRGIHGDSKTWKLITCLLGRFYLVIIDCDRNSPEFGRWVSFTLTDRNRHQVLVPPNHGVAHLALSEKIIFSYKQSTYYDPSIQFTYKWDDPRFSIWWPTKSPTLSQRDDAGRYVD